MHVAGDRAIFKRPTQAENGSLAAFWTSDFLSGTDRGGDSKRLGNFPGVAPGHQHELQTAALALEEDLCVAEICGLLMPFEALSTRPRLVGSRLRS
jgi:hypothetical protein